MINKHFLWPLLLCCIFGSCNKQAHKPLTLENGLVIENITVISPHKQAAIGPATVVIQDDTIRYVGQEELALQGSYQTLDGKGKFLIPGLIDSHVHVSTIAGMSYEQEQDFPHLVKAYLLQQPKSYLYFGFTTLIDLAGFDFGRVQQFQQSPLKPDLYHAGNAVVANGYPMYYFPESIRFELFPDFLYLSTEAPRIPKAYTRQAHSPESVVSRIKQSGALAVKTFYEPGFDSHGLPLPTAHLLSQLLKESHKHKLMLVAHGNSLSAHQALTQAGVDIIAHGLWNWDKYSSAQSLPDEIRTILEEQSKKKIGYMPTLQVIEGLRALWNPGFLLDPKLVHVLPQAMIDFYKTDAGQAYANQLRGEVKAEQISELYGQISSHGQSALSYAINHQGRILFATDTPSGPTYGNPPGYNGYLELQGMHKAGMSLRAILQAVTLENARAFHLDGSYGTVEEAKVANLLILDKDPLVDITAYDALHKVILHGKPIERKSLSAQP